MLPVSLDCPFLIGPSVFPNFGGVVIATDCTGSFKSYYHTIMTTIFFALRIERYYFYSWFVLYVLFCIALFCFALFWFVLLCFVLVCFASYCFVFCFVFACLFVCWLDFCKGKYKIKLLGMIALYVLWTIYTNSGSMSYVHIIYHILSVLCITALGFSPLQHFFIITYIYIVLCKANVDSWLSAHNGNSGKTHYKIRSNSQNWKPE